MSSGKKSKIIQRIENHVAVPNLSEILADKIVPSDLQSLLLYVYQKRGSNRNPRDILLDYSTNKFLIPSQRDPKLLLEWDRTAFSHLPEGFEAIELSPIAPLGCISSLAPVSQDWIVTTIRNTEIISDTTNVLALECALRRQKFLQTKFTKTTPVHLACSHRVLRSQRYKDSNQLQHFRIFSLCSAGRSRENLHFELDTICTHIQFYLDSITSFLGNNISSRVTILDLSPDSQNEGIISEFLVKLKGQANHKKVKFEIVINKETTYYQNLRFHIHVKQNNHPEFELVDGGVTDWTKKLLNNAKERLVISGIGSERLCLLKGIK